MTARQLDTYRACRLSGMSALQAWDIAHGRDPIRGQLHRTPRWRGRWRSR